MSSGLLVLQRSYRINPFFAFAPNASYTTQPGPEALVAPVGALLDLGGAYLQPATPAITLELRNLTLVGLARFVHKCALSRR